MADPEEVARNRGREVVTVRDVVRGSFVVICHPRGFRAADRGCED